MPDTDRVLKEQSMVVRRTEHRDFGLTTGWSEEDGTTTTYQPYARSAGSQRRTGPVARSVQQRALPPASLYTRRPSGVQPKVAATVIEEIELEELDEPDLKGNPFARRRSAASASVRNALGFAGLFASVLIGRVIVEAGQAPARAAEARTGAKVVQPSAAAAGAAGVGPSGSAPEHRNEAALAPEPTANSDVPGAPAGHSAQPANEQPEAAEPTRTDSAQLANEEPEAAEPTRTRTPRADSAQLANEETEAPEPTRARTPRANSAQPANEQPEAAEPTRTRMPRTDSAQPANDEPEAAEPARTRTHRARSSAEARPASNDWRVGPIEPAVSAAPEPAPPASNDWRVGPIEPAVSAASNAALGTLRINSRPWSEVYLDGRLIGNTPQMGLRVPAGRYTVRLSNPELGMSKTIVVQVAAGEHVTRIESLE